MKKIYIFKHYPPPPPFLWPWDVCLELSFLQPPLWKNPGSAPKVSYSRHILVVPISTSVCLRWGSSSRPMATRTERFSNFVIVLNINLVNQCSVLVYIYHSLWGILQFSLRTAKGTINRWSARISCRLRGCVTAVKFISLIYANFASLFTTELEKLLLNDKTKACLPSIISKVINNKKWTLKTVRLTFFPKRRNCDPFQVWNLRPHQLRDPWSGVLEKYEINSTSSLRAGSLVRRPSRHPEGKSHFSSLDSGSPAKIFPEFAQVSLLAGYFTRGRCIYSFQWKSTKGTPLQQNGVQHSSQLCIWHCHIKYKVWIGERAEDIICLVRAL